MSLSRNQLRQIVADNIIDNFTFLNTPQKVREVCIAIINHSLNLNDDNTTPIISITNQALKDTLLDGLAKVGFLYVVNDAGDGSVHIVVSPETSTTLYPMGLVLETGQTGTYSLEDDTFDPSGGGGTGNISEVLTVGNVANVDMVFANGKQLWFANEDATDQAYIGFDGTDLGDTPELKLKYLSTFIAEGLEGEERLRLDELGGKITGSIDGNPDDISEVGAGYDSGLGLAVASMFADDGTNSTLFQVRPDGLFLNGSPYAPGGGGSQDLASVLAEGNNTGPYNIKVNSGNKLIFLDDDNITDASYFTKDSDDLIRLYGKGLIVNYTGTAGTRTAFSVAKNPFDDNRSNILFQSIRDSDQDHESHLFINGSGSEFAATNIDGTETHKFHFHPGDEHYPIIKNHLKSYHFKEEGLWLNDIEPSDGFYLRHIDGVGLVYDAGPSPTGLPASNDGDLFQDQAGTVVATPIIQDNLGFDSIDFNNRRLYKADGVTVAFDWEADDLPVIPATTQGQVLQNQGAGLVATGTIQDDGGFDVLSLTERALYDIAGNQSIHFQSRGLFDPSNLLVLSWFDKQVFDSTGQISIDWEARNLVKFDGTTVAFDWENDVLITTALLTTDGQILQRQGGEIIATQVLHDDLGNISVDYSGRSAQNVAGSVVLDWEGLNLRDDLGAEALNWKNRQLLKSDGTTVSIDWENETLFGASTLTEGQIWQQRSGNLVATNVIRDDAGFPFINMQTREMFDDTGTISGNILKRQLYKSDGITVGFDWDGITTAISDVTGSGATADEDLEARAALDSILEALRTLKLIPT